jgi:3-oxoacyl-[acyl-carrier-protein] synthase-3
VTNDELAKTIDTSDEWIFSHTGIKSRHIAAEDEAASDLGVKAVEGLFADSDIGAGDVELVIVATSTPDYLGLPSTACVIQDRIGAHKAGAMDVMAACSGFVYGLDTARAYVRSGQVKNALVIGAEVYSKIVNWKDRSTCVLFGDGAGAALVAPAVNEDSRLIDSILKSLGRDAESLLRPEGGTRKPTPPGEPVGEGSLLQMDGRKVYTFAVKAIIDTVEELLARNEMSINDVDHIIPHQANVRIIEAACKRRDWPREKFFLNLREYANTSAASIPMAMTEMIRRDILHRGETVITVGFGAGLTYGGNLFSY